MLNSFENNINIQDIEDGMMYDINPNHIIDNDEDEDENGNEDDERDFREDTPNIDMPPIIHIIEPFIQSIWLKNINDADQNKTINYCDKCNCDYCNISYTYEYEFDSAEYFNKDDDGDGDGDGDGTAKVMSAIDPLEQLTNFHVMDEYNYMLNSYFNDAYVNDINYCYKYIKDIKGDDINITKIYFAPNHQQSHIFDSTTLEEISKHHVLEISFNNRNDISKPDMLHSLNNLLDGTTTMICIKSYCGDINELNLPMSIRYVSIHKEDMENSESDNEITFKLDNLNINKYDIATLDPKSASIIRKNIEYETRTKGQLQFAPNLISLNLSGILYIDFESLPLGLQYFTLGDIHSYNTKYPFYIRDYDFSRFTNLIVLNIYIRQFNTIICPDNLKVLVLNTTLYDKYISKDIKIIMPNTLERLSSAINIANISHFPKKLKTLDIILTDVKLFINMINEMDNNILEELIISVSHDLFTYNKNKMNLFTRAIAKLNLNLLIVKVYAIPPKKNIINFEDIFKTNLLQLNTKITNIYFINKKTETFLD